MAPASPVSGLEPNEPRASAALDGGLCLSFASADCAVPPAVKRPTLLLAHALMPTRSSGRGKYGSGWPATAECTTRWSGARADGDVASSVRLSRGHPPAMRDESAPSAYQKWWSRYGKE